MNGRLIVRAVLVIVLVATASSPIWRSPKLEHDIRGAVIALAARAGWSAYESTPDPSDPLGTTVSFKADGCDQPGKVYFVDLGLQLAPMLDRAIAHDYSRRIVYLGKTWFAPDRADMRLEWFKSKLLALFGVGKYVPNETALVIAEPRGCHIAEKVNWSAAWLPHTDTTHFRADRL